MEASLQIWPQSKKVAEDIVIPISFTFRPFDNGSNLNSIPNSKLVRCYKCNALVTSIFSDAEKIECPFCDTIISRASDGQVSFQDFQIDHSSKPLTFYICFVFDLRCSQEFVAITKIYLSIALRAILPETKFLFLCLHSDFVSFIKIRNGKPMIFDFPITAKIFELVSLDFFLNTHNDVENLIEYIQNLKNLQEATLLKEFQNMFIPIPNNIFINFIVFTPLEFHASHLKNMSFDVVSASPFKHNLDIDGVGFSQQSVEDLNLQVQALVQRLVPNQFALNMKLLVHAPPLIEVTPSSFQISAIRSGFSKVFHISLAKTASIYSEIPIEIIASFDLPINEKQVIHRTVVSSRKFKTSKNYFSILSTVNPVVVARSLTITKEFVKSIFELYTTKICANLPSFKGPDPYFTLLPNLRWLLRFLLFTKRQGYSTFFADFSSELALFYSQISFWESEDIMSENNVSAVPFVQELMGNPQIVVIDNSYKIDIFCDSLISPDSELSKFIKTKVSNRFPVPRVTTKPLSKLKTFLPPEEEWNEMISQILLSPDKNQQETQNNIADTQ